MTGLILVTAQYLPLVIPLAAALAWLTLPRAAKLPVAAQAILALVLAFALIRLGASLHVDPRPFVIDPSRPALFAHSADNGFPSDHTTLTATVALVVMAFRRRLGWLLLAASVLVGVARVAAHVHHVQDIVAGLLIAAAAVGITKMVWHWAAPGKAALGDVTPGGAARG